MSGALGKLTMVRYDVPPGDGPIRLDSGSVFTVMINPAEFKHSAGITYDNQKTLGEPKADPKFNAVDKERVSFTLVLDGTGAVPGVGPVPVPVKLQLEQLRWVVYDYIGNKHEPPHVRLIWGTLIFFGRLESMSTQYTLFKPTGEPLRAKVDLSFVGAASAGAIKRLANLSSPDLSHRVLVREGDTLPLLCERIYGDPGYYLDVARVNQLHDFRRLVPGRQLHFPPLE